MVTTTGAVQSGSTADNIPAALRRQVDELEAELAGLRVQLAAAASDRADALRRSAEVEDQLRRQLAESEASRDELRRQASAQAALLAQTTALLASLRAEYDTLATRVTRLAAEPATAATAATAAPDLNPTRFYANVPRTIGDHVRRVWEAFGELQDAVNLVLARKWRRVTSFCQTHRDHLVLALGGVCVVAVLGVLLRRDAPLPPMASAGETPRKESAVQTTAPTPGPFHLRQAYGGQAQEGKTVEMRTVGITAPAPVASELAAGAMEERIRNGARLAQAGQYRAAIEVFVQLLAEHPNHPRIINNLAYLLATAPDDQARDGARAVRLAEIACGLTQYEDPGVLDTLAAGYAETGQFDRAIETTRKAEALWTKLGDDRHVSTTRSNRALYELQMPLRYRR